MTEDFDQQYFKNKKAALEWYQSNGGQRKKASFYEHVSANGRSVSRFAVSEMLRAERPQSVDTEAYSQRMAELDLQEKELKIAKLERADDYVKKLEQQVADHRKQIAALLLYFYHTVKYQLSKAPIVIAAALGHEQNRIPEIADQLDQAIDRAMNEIANNKKQLQIEIVEE